MKNLLEQLADARKVMDEQHVPEHGRFLRCNPNQLYNLVSGLQKGLSIDSQEYKELERCKHAVACANWDIVEITMPDSVLGMRIKLVV